MNAENFVDYLNNPSQLYQISFQELKSLVIQYPYSQNLRYLLAKKAKMDNHEDFEKILALASTYSHDRKFLFNQLRGNAQESQQEDNYMLNEDFLELKDLNELEMEFAGEQTGVNDEMKSLENDLAFAFEEPVYEEESADMAEELFEEAEILTDEPEESAVERNLIVEEAVEEIEEEQQEVVEVNSNEASEIVEEENSIAEEEYFETANEEAIEEVVNNLSTQTTEIGVEDSIIEHSIKEMIVEEEESIKLDSAEETVDKEKVVKLSDLDKKEEKDIEVEEEGIIVQEEKKAVEEQQLDEFKSIPLEITNTKDLSEKEERIQPEPLPKSSFNSWLQQFQSPGLGTNLEKANEKSKKAKKKKQEKLREQETLGVAKASIKEDDEIVSETLALILEKQGHYKKAIKMYKSLSLSMPEKSDYFAAKIETLIKELDN